MYQHIDNRYFRRNSKRYNSYYINRFMSMKCAADLLIKRIFPNAKEITESFSAFAATKQLNQDHWRLSNRDINVVCVGDGHTPRTAATFAYRSAWNCISIDPEMKLRNYGIDRLKCYRNKIQELKLEFDGPTLIVCVHAHVKLDWCLDSIKAPSRAIIAIPCCMPHTLDKPADIEYDDEDMWSPMNKVKIWNSV